MIRKTATPIVNKAPVNNAIKGNELSATPSGRRRKFSVSFPNRFFRFSYYDWVIFIMKIMGVESGEIMSRDSIKAFTLVNLAQITLPYADNISPGYEK